MVQIDFEVLSLLQAAPLSTNKQIWSFLLILN
jgi:hypothetical protein